MAKSYLKEEWNYVIQFKGVQGHFELFNAGAFGSSSGLKSAIC